MENTNAQIIMELRKLRRLFDNHYVMIASQEGLTKIEIIILGFLGNNPSFNTARNMEELLDLKKSNLSVAIEDLTNKAYLAKENDSIDRRITRLTLLPKAHTIIQRMKEKQEILFKKVFEGITEKEIDAYFLIVKKIFENISKVREE